MSPSPCQPEMDGPSEGQRPRSPQLTFHPLCVKKSKPVTIGRKIPRAVVDSQNQDTARNQETKLLGSEGPPPNPPTTLRSWADAKSKPERTCPLSCLPVEVLQQKTLHTPPFPFCSSSCHGPKVPHPSPWGACRCHKGEAEHLCHELGRQDNKGANR